MMECLCLADNLMVYRPMFQALCSKAVYVHCAAHSLNLAESNSCEVASITNCLGTMGKLPFFIHRKESPSWSNVYNKQKFVQPMGN